MTARKSIIRGFWVANKLSVRGEELDINWRYVDDFDGERK
jgi:hypothetical protein